MRSVFHCFILAISTLSAIASPVIDVDDRVINGRDSGRPGTYPYMAAYVQFWEWFDKEGRVTNNKTVEFCGASILTAKWVLTAAHCTASFNYERHRVKTGISDVRCDQDSQVRRIKRVIDHEEYRPWPLLLNDISLLLLEEPLVLDRYTNVIRLPAASLKITDDTVGLLSGWGLTASEGEFVECPQLQIGLVPVHEQNKCKEIFQGLHVADSIICAGDLANGSVSSCGGDSGGPLTLDYHTRDPTLIGIVSYGSSGECTSHPAAYTDVRLFLDWIKRWIPQEELKW